MSDTRKGSSALVSVDEIVCTDRHRKDLGDIDSLIASISEVGLLQPIVVDEDNRLIAGQRRLEAFKRQGAERIAALFVAKGDALYYLLAERDENTCRKDFAPSEAVALGADLEHIEKAKAKKRQAKAGGDKRRDTPQSASGNLPEALPDSKTHGDTRDKVASVVGMSGKSYEQAKSVCASGDDELIKHMDKTGNVSRAYNKLPSNGEKKERETITELETRMIDYIRKGVRQTKGGMRDRLIDSLKITLNELKKERKNG